MLPIFQEAWHFKRYGEKEQLKCFKCLWNISKGQLYVSFEMFQKQLGCSKTVPVWMRWYFEVFQFMFHVYGDRETHRPFRIPQPSALGPVLWKWRVCSHFLLLAASFQEACYQALQGQVLSTSPLRGGGGKYRGDWGWRDRIPAEGNPCHHPFSIPCSTPEWKAAAVLRCSTQEVPQGHISLRDLLKVTSVYIQNIWY